MRYLYNSLYRSNLFLLSFVTDLYDVVLPGMPCHVTTTASTWTQTSPLGFFYENRWHMTRCTGVSRLEDFRRCLRGQTLILFGDSTTRQWYESVQDMLQCEQTSRKWLSHKWREESTSVNHDLNFTVKWIPHSQPFYNDDNRPTCTSVPTTIADIGSHENVIIVFHMYAHFLTYHHQVFWGRIRKVRKAIVDLFDRNPNVVIAIKGPHSFNTAYMNKALLNDYMGFMYTDILRYEFRDQRDRVIYLDQRDITIAAGCQDIHPDRYVVDQMVRTMLALVC
jgi:hypothetical protein